LTEEEGGSPHAGETDAWTRDSFWSHELHRLRGIVQYPEAA